MIRIEANISEDIEIVSKGHAEYNPGGPDIVCAAVSALLGTWRECIAGFEAQGFVREMDAMVNDGDYRVYCVPCAGYETYVLACLATILTGLALVEASYPENVSLKINEGDREKS